MNMNDVEIALWEIVYKLDQYHRERPNENGYLYGSTWTRRLAEKIRDQQYLVKSESIKTRQDLLKLQYRCAYHTKGAECAGCSMNERCDAFDLINKIFDGADLKRR